MSIQLCSVWLSYSSSFGYGESVRFEKTRVQMRVLKSRGWVQGYDRPKACGRFGIWARDKIKRYFFQLWQKLRPSSRKYHHLHQLRVINEKFLSARNLHLLQAETSRPKGVCVVVGDTVRGFYKAVLSFTGGDLCYVGLSLCTPCHFNLCDFSAKSFSTLQRRGCSLCGKNRCVAKRLNRGAPGRLRGFKF